MRGGYSEPLAMLGFVLGMLIMPIAGQWASPDSRVHEALAMCEALFMVAFLVGLARYLFRGFRWLARALRPRDPESPT
ncbi:hypothetical protein ACFXJ8_08980 [Nonomuraea sp. NPDC059194]|uniref:hypothetical protein n=1 Tax=Nonomuraea sp. NPDC059194 TaxID=3346764 RepID=UPI0036A365E8